MAPTTLDPWEFRSQPGTQIRLHGVAVLAVVRRHRRRPTKPVVFACARQKARRLPINRIAQCSRDSDSVGPKSIPGVTWSEVQRFTRKSGTAHSLARRPLDLLANAAAESGHDGETTRAGHPVRRAVSVQFSASRVDSEFENPRVPRTWKGVLFVGKDFRTWCCAGDEGLALRRRPCGGRRQTATCCVG